MIDRFFNQNCFKCDYDHRKVLSVIMTITVQQWFSTFLWQWNLAQMFALLLPPYAMIQVSSLLQPHRTVVVNFVPGNFGLLRNPMLKNTAVQSTAAFSNARITL